MAKQTSFRFPVVAGLVVQAFLSGVFLTVWWIQGSAVELGFGIAFAINPMIAIAVWLIDIVIIQMGIQEENAKVK